MFPMFSGVPGAPLPFGTRKRRFRKRGKGGGKGLKEHSNKAIATKALPHNPHTLIQLVSSSTTTGTHPQPSLPPDAIKAQPGLSQPITTKTQSEPTATTYTHPGSCQPTTNVQERQSQSIHTTKIQSAPVQPTVTTKVQPGPNQPSLTTKTHPGLSQTTTTNVALPQPTSPMHSTQAEGNLLPKTRKTRVRKRRRHSSLYFQALMLGYSFTSSVTECRNHLASFGGEKCITPQSVASNILLMTQTHTVLFRVDPGCSEDTDESDSSDEMESSHPANREDSADTKEPKSNDSVHSSQQSSLKDVSALEDVKSSDNASSLEPLTCKNAAGKKELVTNVEGVSSEPSTWKVDVFLQAVKELCPNFAWKEVISKLDNPQFVLIDRKGLELLVLALKEIIQPQISFPGTITKNFLYKRWKHPHGQFSLIQQTLMNQDILPITKLPFQPVLTDILKPLSKNGDEESKCWHSLDLVNMLLCLSEVGVYDLVKDVFEVPLRVCPEVLFLALLQSTPVYTNKLRDELIKALIPMFLENLPNSTDILSHAWKVNIQGKNCFQTMSLNEVISHAMSEWYTDGNNDSTRLKRLFDLALELKALTQLLSSPLDDLFLIDLACLGSQEGLMRLEKWMTFKLRSGREEFFSSCVKFLQRRHPKLTEGVLPEDIVLGGAESPRHSSLSIVRRLLLYVHSTKSVPEELANTVRTMATTCGIVYRQPEGSSPEPQKRERSRGGRGRGWEKPKKVKTSDDSSINSTPTPSNIPTASSLPTTGGISTQGGTLAGSRPTSDSTPTPGGTTPYSWTTPNSWPTPCSSSTQGNRPMRSSWPT